MKANVLNCSIIILLILLFSISGNTPARAAPGDTVVFIVDKMYDGADDNVGDGNCFNSEQSGCTLRAALQEASLAVGSSNVEINLPQMEYDISIPKNSGVPDGASGDLDLDPLTASYPYRITIQSTTGWMSEINAYGLDRVLHIGANHKVTLINIRITGGLTYGISPSLGMGAGITVEHDAEVTLERVKVHHNEVNCDGGGICRGGGIATNNADLTIQNSVIEYNKAREGSAIYAFDELDGRTHFTTIRNSIISDNDTELSAIHSFTELRLINSTVYYNLGPQGPLNVWAAGFAWIQNSTVGSMFDGYNVFGSNNLRIRNSILFSVPGGSVTPSVCTFQPNMPSPISEGGNVFTDPSCNPLPTMGDMVIPVQSILLAGLMNNLSPDYGGPIWPLSPFAGSPAHNRRQSPCMVNDLIDGLPQELPLLEDARNFPRWDGRCDAGAIEITYFTYLPAIKR